MQRGKHVSDDELEGRTSGDLAWRLARGETQGGAGERRNKMVESSPIELSQLEEENLTFELQYSSAEDKLVVGNSLAFLYVCFTASKLIPWHCTIFLTSSDGKPLWLLEQLV